VTRRDTHRFWVVTGGSVGMHDRAWMMEHLPQDGSVHLFDLTSSHCCLGVWGPQARALVQSVSENDVSNEAFPYYSAKSIFIGSVPCFAMRISYAGEFGWELYTSTEYGLRLWDTLWKAGQDFGVTAAGGGAFDSLRLEKGYRLWGADIHSEYNPYEAGIGFAVKLSKADFIGKSALEVVKANGVKRKLVCMTLNDDQIVLLGKEPLLKDGEVLGYVSSANYGYTVGKSILYGYLPVSHAQVGQTVDVLYFGQKYLATVTQEPLFDPKHLRLKDSH
jgi:dimethylglycine oxidase